MSQKPVYIFIAGIFLLILGYSFLNFQGEKVPPLFSKLGIALSLAGGVMFIGALIFQMKRRTEN